MQPLQTVLVSVMVKFFLQCIVSCSAKNDVTPTILYITPNVNVPCPGVPCLTLSQYVQDQDAYFESDTELLFLSGVHQISSPIVIDGCRTNITKLVLYGIGQGQSELISHTTVGQGSLTLTGINSTRIKSLHFRGLNILTVVDSLSLIASDLHFNAVNGALINVYFLSSSMRAILASSRANLIPMQLRGPKPNGK